MKALSLWQPWASLVALGEKRYETRHWSPRGALRRGELLAIHAAKKWTKEESGFCYQEPFRSALLKHGIQFPDKQLPRGAMLCICKFTDIFHVEDVVRTLSKQELAFGNYSYKRFAWQLEVMHVFDPVIPTAGQQGLFEWEIPATNGDVDEDEAAAKVIALPGVEMPMKIEQMRLF